MKSGLWLAAIAAVLTVPHVALAKSAVREGFGTKQVTGKRILVFAPQVHTGSQSAGGTVTPNGDWTDKAKRNIAQALAEAQGRLGNHVSTTPELFGEDARRADEYISLFASIADSVIEYQFVKGNRLPTKKRDNKEGIFDWSVGPEVGTLPGASDADYALFIFNDDAYGSTGRKILQVVAILGAGVAVTSGDHRGFAGLVDLRTGNIVWMNADPQMGGDVRDPEGAVKRVRQLLEGLPGARADG